MTKEILERLEQLGVRYHVAVWGGETVVPAAMARMFLENNFDKEQVQSHLAGVSVEIYRKWVDWNAMGQPCQALTKRGAQCRKNLRYPRMFGPGGFEKGGFCDLHWEKFNE